MSKDKKKIKLDLLSMTWFAYWEWKYIHHVLDSESHNPPLCPWTKVQFCLGLSENVMLGIKEWNKQLPPKE